MCFVVRCDSGGDRHRLGVTEAATGTRLVVSDIALDGTITANLRAPVVINPERMVGQQVVPYHCVYPIRHVIVEGEQA